jgi:Phage integrase, N-terminal SAM-like domain
MQKPKLLYEVRNVARLKHLGRGTEMTYVNFIRRFILYRYERHPREMGAEEIRALSLHVSPAK